MEDQLPNLQLDSVVHHQEPLTVIVTLNGVADLVHTPTARTGHGGVLILVVNRRSTKLD